MFWRRWQGEPVVPTYNGWDEVPEDEREELELWEASNPLGRRRSSQAIPRPDISATGESL
jgi:hypothetical protein